MDLYHIGTLDKLGLASLGVVTITDGLGWIAALVTIAAMLPLAIWRWRAMWRERKGYLPVRPTKPDDDRDPR